MYITFKHMSILLRVGVSHAAENLHELRGLDAEAPSVTGQRPMVASWLRLVAELQSPSPSWRTTPGCPEYRMP